MPFEKGCIPWNKGKKIGPLSKKHKRNIGLGMIGKKNSKGYKFSKDQIEIRSEKMKGNKNSIGKRSITTRRRNKKSAKKSWKNPSDELLRTIDNGFGTKCYSNDGLYFSSLGERDCYYWARDDVDEVIGIEHPFGRIDFLLILNNGKEVALEYHPYDVYGRTSKQYYKDRRKLLDELGYKDLKLIVMTSLKDEEKDKVINRLREVL